MKYLPGINFNVIAAIVFTGLLCGCHHESNELAHNHNHAHDSADIIDEGEHNHSPSHIIIEPEQAQKLGIKVSRLKAGEFQEAIPVDGAIDYSPVGQGIASARSGGILTFSPSITLGSQVVAGQAIASISGAGMAGGDVTENARVQVEAAKRELQRLEPLHAEGIVSTRDYNAALQAYEIAKAALGATSSSRGSVVTSPVTGVITSLTASQGQAVNPGDAIATIASSNQVVLRVNVPVRYSSDIASFTDADFRINGTSGLLSVSKLNGHRVNASTVIAQNGYIPLYFSISNKTLTPGTYCEVYLHSPQKNETLSLPLSAISEQQGQTFVYVRLDADGYEKRPVSLGRSSADRVEVAGGLHAGDDVVTEGVTFLRLGEASGVRPEGHTH